MIASQNGRVEVVNTLLQHGARVDLQKKVSAEMLYFVIIHHVQLYLKMLTILHDRYIAATYYYAYTYPVYLCSYSILTEWVHSTNDCISDWTC